MAGIAYTAIEKGSGYVYAAENFLAFSTPALWCRVFCSRLFHHCTLVPRFPFSPFPPLQFGAAFSVLAFSTPAFSTVPSFPFPPFQSSRRNSTCIPDPNSRCNFEWKHAYFHFAIDREICKQAANSNESLAVVVTMHSVECITQLS